MIITREEATKKLTDTLENMHIPYVTDEYLVQPDTAAIFVEIKIPSIGIAINVNEPVDVSVDTNRSLKRNRAQERTLIAHAAGYGLMQMISLDFDQPGLWPYLKNKLNAYATGRETIGARECNITQISARERNQFLTAWHAQGPVKRAGISVALTTKTGDVLACMSLGKSRYASEGLEMVRYCTRPNVAVAGGFDRLLAHARKLVGENVPITSYADLNTSLRPTTIYDKLFEFQGLTSPDYRWVNPLTGDIRSRYQCMKHKLIAEGADKSLTERQIMKSRGYIRVYGPGSKRYVLK